MSAAIDPGELTALVLAGGRGSRFGGIDKGLVRFAGQPLAAHVVSRLRPQADTLLISANRNLPIYEQMGARVLPDPPASAYGAATPRVEGRGAVSAAFDGPLVGWLAALQAARTPWLLCAPCDTPFLPLDLAARLAAGMTAQNRIAYASTLVDSTLRQHYLCALIRCGGAAERHALADDLAAYLRSGARRVGSWQQRHMPSEVRFDEGRAFYNINDHALLAAARSAGSHPD